MSTKGDPYDNAAAESFFSNLKNELTHHKIFHSREHARLAILNCIEVFYNRQRIHLGLGYRTPVQVEASVP
ncbi:integrase core domain-containing protein [Achromobacter anxifer]